ncbi:MAG: DNA internalization-related competence protein ComEC/Rec2 [Candidatus Galacturonibacter soehngenii]|nr:DNA internalization-related competence protein ComEC/Rec2 [Candidatus Galacturonibacter soehngenii]
MNRRPLCIAALVYIIVIGMTLLIDTLQIANMPLTLNESVAAGLVKDKEMVSISGKVYKQESKNDKLLLYLNETILYQNSSHIKANHIIVYTNQMTQIPNGYKVLVKGKVKKFQKASNLGQFNSYLYYKSLNIDFIVVTETISILENQDNFVTNTLYQLRNSLANNFDLITKEDTQSATFKAMLLGDASEFTGDLKDLYQKGGILHIVCISGTHIGIVGMFLFALLRKCGVDFRLSCLLCIVVVILYGIMTGFGVSAYRAVIMFAIGMLAKVLGRTYDLLSALALAAILILIENPYYILNLGFLLSFGAILGIGVVSPVISKGFDVKSKIAGDFLTSVSVTFVTLPILLYFYYEFPIYSILLNLIVIPISSIVLASGILGLFCAEFSISLGTFMLGIGSYILKLYELLCKVSLKLPYSSLIIGKPSVIQILIYYGILFGVLYGLKKWKQKYLTVLFLIMIAVVTIRLPQGFWVTFLDVGQGEGIVIHTTNHTTYMVDGGSSNVNEVGKYRILPFLKAKGIRKLDYSILTHPDGDHTSGIIELIKSGYPIDTLVLPEIGIKDEAYMELEQLAVDAGIQLLYLHKGSIIKDGQLQMECLHPYKEYLPKSQNDYSVVLSLRYESLNMLLTGDLETKGENEVMKLLKEDYDILKVAHHGSKNSTSSAFLRKLQAEYAIISCGENNRYGHPHEELLERLNDNDMHIMTTKEDGAITIEVKNKTISYSLYGK